jgi:hypothetical protein
MEKITITEALAELRTISKRIEKKREFVGQYLARSAAMRDPLEKEGGSTEAIRREQQAISDLQKRFVDLRRKINTVNLQISLDLNGDTKSLADWIIWKRDIAPGEQRWTQKLIKSFEDFRKQATQRGGRMNPDEEYNKEDVIVSMDEKKLHEHAESLEEALGSLDGKLSLANAVNFIEL